MIIITVVADLGSKVAEDVLAHLSKIFRGHCCEVQRVSLLIFICADLQLTSAVVLLPSKFPSCRCVERLGDGLFNATHFQLVICRQCCSRRCRVEEMTVLLLALLGSIN